MGKPDNSKLAASTAALDFVDSWLVFLFLIDKFFADGYYFLAVLFQLTRYPVTNTTPFIQRETGRKDAGIACFETINIPFSVIKSD